MTNRISIRQRKLVLGQFVQPNPSWWCPSVAAVLWSYDWNCDSQLQAEANKRIYHIIKQTSVFFFLVDLHLCPPRISNDIDINQLLNLFTQLINNSQWILWLKVIYSDGNIRVRGLYNVISHSTFSPHLKKYIHIYLLSTNHWIISIMKYEN